MFCIVIQKYVIEYAYGALFDGMEKTGGDTVIVVRQTIMAIELLFIIIPIRHNYSLEHVES